MYLLERGDVLKKRIIFLMMSLTLITYGEEITPTEAVTETAIEVVIPKKTLNEILSEKQYLKDYLKSDYTLNVIYKSDEIIEKIEFSKKDFIQSFQFYSFEEDKIFKNYEKKQDIETTKEYDINGKLRKTEKISKDEKNIEEYYENGILNKREKTVKDLKTIEEYSEKSVLKRVEKISKTKKTYEEYYENKKIKEKGQYVLINNKWEKTENWEEYYESGKIKNIYLFNGNEYYEISYLDDENNNKIYEGTNVYIDEKWYKDGMWTFYENGKLSYRADFLKEKGKFYNYYDDISSIVSIETSVAFIDNAWVWHGQKIFYSNTGKILEKQFKENNILSITGYYENTKNTIRYKGERDLSKTGFPKIGTWIYFNEEEKIIEVIEYSDKEAKIKEYFDFENNKIKFSGNIIKKGEYFSWIGSQVYYDKNSNKEVEIEFYEDGKGKITHYYENDKIFKEGQVYSEYIQNPTFYVGQLKEYDKNGKLKALYNYENGLLEGEILYYDNNEKLSVKKLYKKGELLKIEEIK